ncbi:MAG: hypothetical protein Q4D96_07015 [Propionibacteriaceae bacterium]|nr:hypothetical protein [Propionibacteriaceae bacterium]
MVMAPPSQAAVAAPLVDGEHVFTSDGVEFRVGGELVRKLAKGGARAQLFDEIVGGYLAAMPQVAQAIRAELTPDWFDPAVLGTGAEEIAACLGPVTVHTVSRKWGTRLTYTEHRIDEDHLLDLEITGAWESIDEVGLDG